MIEQAVVQRVMIARAIVQTESGRRLPVSFDTIPSPGDTVQIDTSARKIVDPAQEPAE